VSAESAISIVRAHLSPGPDTAPPRAPERVPARVAQMLALAHHIEDQIAAGAFRDRAHAAEVFGLTRPRITQLCALTLLAPDIQEEILFLEAVRGAQPLSERALRHLVRLLSWAEQRRLWTALRS